MPAYDNINGTLRKVSKIYDNINGTLREAKAAYDNINGVLRKYHTGESGPPKFESINGGSYSNQNLKLSSWAYGSTDAPGSIASAKLVNIPNNTSISISFTVAYEEAYSHTFRVGGNQVKSSPYSFTASDEVLFELVLSTPHGANMDQSAACHLNMKTTVNGTVV